VPGEGHLPDAETFVFDCSPDSGRAFSFTVRVDTTSAWLWLPPSMRVEPVRLHAVRSASGARFEGEDVVFWNKGEEALLEVNGRSFPGCTVDHYRSVWEHAKLNGVDFRAVGNEPGWVLDIYQGDRFDLEWRYGERTAVLPYTEPGADAGGATTYRSETDEHALVVTITGGGCTDSMSGKSFDARVTIRIDGSEYTGCGRALH
jgi:putative lipoprotein